MPAFRGIVWYSARLTRYDYFHTLDRMKTAISIPDPIFQAAELFAHHFGISRSELYAKAIEEYIASRRFMNVTAALNKIYGDEPSGLDDELYSMQIKSIPREEW